MNFEKLNQFFSQVKAISFWDRIFNWGAIKALSYDAYDEYRKIQTNLEAAVNELSEKISTIRDMTKDYENQGDLVVDLKTKQEAFETKIQSLTDENTRLTNEGNASQNLITEYETKEESNRELQDQRLAEIATIKEGLEQDRTSLRETREAEIEERQEEMKRTWSIHEDNVEEDIKRICQKHTIKYEEKPPFKGSPDNVVDICAEYIVFDAKSPANDDLSNFPTYIKSQAESAKKYAKQEGVCPDIYLVVPTNAIEVLKEYVYNLGDYNVYVITKDSLEIVLLKLRSKEDYEFVDKLSPEDRNNICRVIGKFRHDAKRRIVIDQFLASNSLELLQYTENQLPEDMKDEIMEYEKATKLNPPTEKRSKTISMKELEDKNDSLNAEITFRAGDNKDAVDEIKQIENN